MSERRLPRPTALLGLALALVAPACSNDPEPGSGSDGSTARADGAGGVWSTDPEAPGSGSGQSAVAATKPIQTDAEVARAIRDLITAVTPLPAEAPVGTQSDWFPNRRATLRRLRAAGPAVGRAALAEYHQRDTDLDDIRAGLLDVAAHAATDETVDLLVELITSYGPSLKLRRTATELIGEVAPERALEVLTPILETSDRARTYPPDDIMLAAWLVAADARDVDRVPLLTDVALDFRQSQEVRHLATEALGELHANEDAAAASDALRTLLVESSGNNYLRRKAAQALRSLLTKEELCALLETTLEREAEPSFGLFLSDMIENSCR